MNALGCRRRIYRIVRDLANKVAHFLIKLALEKHAKLVIDVPDWNSLKKLAREHLHGLKASLIQCFIRRALHLMENQAEWYGIPLEKVRLPSTICPKCGNKLIEVEPRMMYCTNCGLKEHRDKIPILYILIQQDKFLTCHISPSRGTVHD